MATFMLKESTSSQKMATPMLKVASDIYKTPLYRTAHSLRTPQTSRHSSSRVSNLTLRSLKPPSSHGSKIIIFHLSQSKCTVSSLFLHGWRAASLWSSACCVSVFFRLLSKIHFYGTIFSLWRERGKTWFH